MDSLKDNLQYMLKKAKENENKPSELQWTPNIDLIEEMIEDLDKERAEHTEIIECYEAMKSGVAVRIGDLEQKNADLRWELDQQKTLGKMLEIHIDHLTRSS
jgi:chromosome segregation ATPase